MTELEQLRESYRGWIIRHRCVEPASGPSYSQYVARDRETGQVEKAKTPGELEKRLRQVSKKSE